jgi:hypothetical protein
VTAGATSIAAGQDGCGSFTTAGISDLERGIICENPGEFIAAVVDTRNYLTHLDEEAGRKILHEVQLYHATTRLEIIMFMLLLKQIGLDGDEILRALKSSGRFDLTPFKATAAK